MMVCVCGGGRAAALVVAVARGVVVIVVVGVAVVAAASSTTPLLPSRSTWTAVTHAPHDAIPETTTATTTGVVAR